MVDTGMVASCGLWVAGCRGVATGDAHHPPAAGRTKRTKARARVGRGYLYPGAVPVDLPAKPSHGVSRDLPQSNTFKNQRLLVPPVRLAWRAQSTEARIKISVSNIGIQYRYRYPNDAMRIRIRWFVLAAVVIALVAWASSRQFVDAKEPLTSVVPSPFPLPKFDTTLYPIKYSLRLTNGINRKVTEKTVTVMSEQHAMVMLLGVLRDVWPAYKVVNNVVQARPERFPDALIVSWLKYKDYPDAWTRWRLDTDPQKHAHTIAAISAYEILTPKHKYHSKMQPLLQDVKILLDYFGHKVTFYNRPVLVRP